jgi:hypothetical protein
MRFFDALKLSLYRFRANLFEPPRFRDERKSESLTIVTEEGVAHHFCHFDYKRQRWVCPFEDLVFTRDKISHWIRPRKEKIFTYSDDDDEDFYE